MPTATGKRRLQSVRQRTPTLRRYSSRLIHWTKLYTLAIPESLFIRDDCIEIWWSRHWRLIVAVQLYAGKPSVCSSEILFIQQTRCTYGHHLLVNKFSTSSVGRQALLDRNIEGRHKEYIREEFGAEAGKFAFSARNGVIYINYTWKCYRFDCMVMYNAILPINFSLEYTISYRIHICIQFIQLYVRWFASASFGCQNFCDFKN